MKFGQAIRSCFNKYASFSGRASRSEYWYFALFTILVTIAAVLLDEILFAELPILDWIVTAVFLIPSLSVGARRLHDRDLSAWWILLSLVPIVGWIIFLVWACQRGTSGSNRFGPDPLLVPVNNTILARA
ncbi:DUF805 domain-containing protein [Microvirga sp. CF3062]|uniref:DUF805 domain-containing protein n=1 Tax=Microvirga sp. CF3062 TaxID=3110182 RepID=UPI002E7811C8|nr:DUF805 domain-containing protein [Microvirga sp. CF3062]MEE1655106.1 DUF805 domain-containing protein [Microvirga sp. CF3062]